MKSEASAWKVWNAETEYGEVFFKRATAELPEMESSKAVAKHIASLIKSKDLILDIGCGAGHYLRSLLNRLPEAFSYHGVDATENYIKLAQEAWADAKHDNLLAATFQQGDIFDIPLSDAYADIVMCNNVLLHLPSIEKPMAELVRVSRKYVVIRALIGESSFRIRQVMEPELYDQAGEPVNYFFYNIYSQTYIQSVLSKLPGVKSVSFAPDHDYDPANLISSISDYAETPKDITKIMNGLQVNNYIIQPWMFVILEKESD
jgi:ubiquinone/menaquinone biosynthesis C-methylase UbiE